MIAKATFDIPETDHQSTNGARRAYRLRWGQNWPHDDTTLRQLAADVPPAEPHFSRCEFLLSTMRECHTFEESQS